MATIINTLEVTLEPPPARPPAGDAARSPAPAPARTPTPADLADVLERQAALLARVLAH